MATIEEFKEAAAETRQVLDEVQPVLADLGTKIFKLKEEDPCVKGFDEKIKDLEQQITDARSQVQDYTTKYKNLFKIYEDLGFFDKRKSEVSDAVAIANVSLKTLLGIVTGLGIKKNMQSIKDAFAACPVLKDPEEKPTQENTPTNTAGDNTNSSENKNDDENPQPSSTTNQTQDPAANDNSNTTTAGTTVSGKSGTPTANKKPRPNKRQFNPLSNLSSYTYNLSLYMLTPDAYNAFVLSGRKDINALKNATQINVGSNQALANSKSGAYLLAQDGGINTDIEKRAIGFEYDYYIDNLKINAIINGKGTGAAANITSITFDIIEPYGFSFITKLKDARDALLKDSKLKAIVGNIDRIPSLKQFFVLGIRFYGYDKNGNIATTSMFSAPSEVNSDAKTGSGDSALFERFYDIVITNMQFKLTGRSTVYNITANITGEQLSFSNRYGRTNKDIKVQATTVYNALLGDSDTEIGLLTSLNKQQKIMEQNNQIGIANVYDVKFVGPSDKLKDAVMMLDNDRDKMITSMASKDLVSSNTGLSVSEANIPNLKSRLLTFKNDTAILQAIGLIISHSSYLANALKVLGTSDLEPPEGGEPIKTKTSLENIKWYNISPIIEVLGFDVKRKDWAYKITYVIQPYETPMVETPVANKGAPYYGPFKRYEYHYTGNNTEVLRYEQQINNLYYNVALSTEDNNKNNLPVATQPHVRANQPRQGTTGQGTDAQNSYINNLYDPASWAQSKISILGDPDFLVQTSPGFTDSQVYDPFYEQDGFTIKPNGGQVFVEVDFKEPTDYNDKGLLSINESIYIVPIPKQFRDKNVVKGVSFMVLSAKSNFKSGKFEQELEMVLNHFNGMTIDTEGETVENQRTDSSQVAGSTTQSVNNTDKPAGLTPYDPPLANNTSVDSAPMMPMPPNPTQTTPDDDAGPL